MSKAGKIPIIAIALVALLMLAAVGYYVMYFRIVAFPTGSMANTLIPGDRVLCDLRGGEIKRGDIVLFKLPTDPKVMYIKRVIGLPGEAIQVKGRRVLINGKELPEERALIRLTGPQEPESPIVKVEPKPQDAWYRVFYDVELSSDGDEFEVSRAMKYGAAEPYQIPQGHYFLLGDSRDNSEDSRYWGTVPRDLIVGKALMVVTSDSKGHEGRFFKPLK